MNRDLLNLMATHCILVYHYAALDMASQYALGPPMQHIIKSHLCSVIVGGKVIALDTGQ